ncbi:hypothetical protein D5086_014810 [Populus alba]|uniref:Uncharacterized protein n=1 Tax=Populus alba TaxID=43335 RepID=A0ACC4C022_POPAL
MDDDSTARLVRLVYNLKELDMSQWANSLQHLDIGGTFITDESLFAIADSFPHLKKVTLLEMTLHLISFWTVVPWSYRRVTEIGLLSFLTYGEPEFLYISSLICLTLVLPFKFNPHEHY